MQKILNSKKAFDHLKVILTIGSYDTMNFGFDSISNPQNVEVTSLKFYFRNKAIIIYSVIFCCFLNKGN